jgi:plasmid maintenance system antidote protein VapI
MLWDLKEAGDGLSYSKMAARSGGLVAVSTLHAVMHGNSKDLTPDTVTGLSRILGVSEGRVLALLRSERQPTAEQASEEKERIWAGSVLV